MKQEQFKKILLIVSDSFGVSVEDILSSKKSDIKVLARHTLYKSINFMGYNLSETGRLLKRDHTTVRHGIKVYNSMRDTNEMFKIKSDKIMEKLKQIAHEE